MASQPANFLQNYGFDLLLGSIAAFYAFMVPYTKVEESFNVQAMHDISYHGHHLESYDHFQFPGVVPRTFIGALFISALSSPIILTLKLLRFPKIYSLLAVRLVLGCLVLSTLRFFRIQVRNKFGRQVEAFFVLFTSLQFHMLFYCTRPLPNILAFGLVNLAYGYWLRGSFYAALRCLIFATLVFRCDMLLLLCPFGLYLLMNKYISFWKAVKCCTATALLCMGMTLLVDSIMWKRLVWPEFEVFWFNSVLNRSSEWGTHPFHWYFTSALPRALLAAYPLFLLGAFLDRRTVSYIFPVFSFVLLYSKLPHKELRFIIGSAPIFNMSAAIAANRIYNNRRKRLWKMLNVVMMGLLFVSLGCTTIFFMASYHNYPSGYALEELHQSGCTTIFFMASYHNYPSGYALEELHQSGCAVANTYEQSVHIDPFSAMNGISRFCEHDHSWRYSKEENISLDEFQYRNFTYLLSEHSRIHGFKCLFIVNGFVRVQLQGGWPPIKIVKEPKVYVQGNAQNKDYIHVDWPGC